MSTEESRGIVLRWANSLIEGKYDDVKALAAPGTTWWFNGLTSKIDAAGPAPFDSRIDAFAAFRETCKSFDASIIDVIAEGNKVTIEFETSATSLTHDKPYRNFSLVKVVVEDGKVTDVREYFDYFAVFEFLGLDPK